MRFVSGEFVVFLAAVLLLYYTLPRKWQWCILLVAGFVFLWADDWRNLIFVIVTAATTFCAALRIERFRQENACKAKTKAVVLLTLLLNLGILAACKYTQFIMDVFFIPWQFDRVFVPIAISYYTFQSISYLVDVYRGKYPAARNFFQYALFVSFFPQMVQGPISRYDDLDYQLCIHHRFDTKPFFFGLMRILWGYFKKLLIADRLVTAVITLAAGAQYTGAFVLVTMLFYAAQLYCDFTGGIDITIGIAQMLGIKLAENFHLPFFSKSIREYWNRWHITMGTWFTDYIFYPICVSKPMRKLNKWSRTHFGKALGKRVTVYLSGFAVWLATGIWHGPAWNFIVWGLVNWAVITASQEMEPLYAKFHAKFHLRDKRPYGIFQIFRTFLLMSAIRMFDVYRDVPMTFRRLFSLLTASNWGQLASGSLLQLGLGVHDYILLAASIAIVLAVSLCKIRWAHFREMLYMRKPIFYGIMGALLMCILIFGAYGIGYDATGFIYDQF